MAVYHLHLGSVGPFIFDDVKARADDLNAKQRGVTITDPMGTVAARLHVDEGDLVVRLDDDNEINIPLKTSPLKQKIEFAIAGSEHASYSLEQVDVAADSTVDPPIEAATIYKVTLNLPANLGGTDMSGLVMVFSDATLAGVGTSGSPLRVANPFSVDEKRHLAAVPPLWTVKAHLVGDQVTFAGKVYICIQNRLADVTDDPATDTIGWTVLGPAGDLNVQSDWNETTDTEDSFIKNKPRVPVPASAIPRKPTSSVGVRGTGTGFSRGDHRHPKQDVAWNEITGKPNLAPGTAEANVQSDFNELDATADEFIKNKPDALRYMPRIFGADYPAANPPVQAFRQYFPHIQLITEADGTQVPAFGWNLWTWNHFAGQTASRPGDDDPEEEYFLGFTHSARAWVARRLPAVLPAWSPTGLYFLGDQVLAGGKIYVSVRDRAQAGPDPTSDDGTNWAVLGVGDSLTAAERGDIAFSNPPGDLTDDEKAAVLSAVGLGDTVVEQEIVLGDSALDGSSFIRWSAAGRIEDALIEGTSQGYLAWFQVTGSSGQITFRISTSSTDFDNRTLGPDMVTAWEVSVSAMTLAAGDLSIDLPGPNHPSGRALDATDPYAWLPSTPTPIELRAFITAWRALSDSDKAGTTLTIRAVVGRLSNIENRLTALEAA